MISSSVISRLYTSGVLQVKRSLTHRTADQRIWLGRWIEARPLRPINYRQMTGLRTGDCVRIDIPDASDPDHDRFHGRYGTIVDVMGDDAGTETGDPRDGTLYRVEFDGGNQHDFRWRDLRPASVE
jgi:ribosomal protein L21E